MCYFPVIISIAFYLFNLRSGMSVMRISCVLVFIRIVFVAFFLVVICFRFRFPGMGRPGFVLHTHSAQSRASRYVERCPHGEVRIIRDPQPFVLPHTHAEGMTGGVIRADLPGAQFTVIYLAVEAFQESRPVIGFRRRIDFYLHVLASRCLLPGSIPWSYGDCFLV